MGDLEKALLDYYRSIPYPALTTQEKGEYTYLLVKEGLEAWHATQEVLQ